MVPNLDIGAGLRRAEKQLMFLVSKEKPVTPHCLCWMRMSELPVQVPRAWLMRKCNYHNAKDKSAVWNRPRASEPSHSQTHWDGKAGTRSLGEAGGPIGTDRSNTELTIEWHVNSAKLFQGDKTEDVGLRSFLLGRNRFCLYGIKCLYRCQSAITCIALRSLQVYTYKSVLNNKSKEGPYHSAGDQEGQRHSAPEWHTERVCGHPFLYHHILDFSHSPWKTTEFFFQLPYGHHSFKTYMPRVGHLAWWLRCS